MRTVLSVLALVAFVSSAKAIPGFGPFAPVEKVRGIILNEYPKSTRNEEETDSFAIAMSGSSRAILRLKRNSAGETLQLTLPSGRSQIWSIGPDLWPHLARVYSACLNEDDLPDFLVTFSSTACGLAAERSDILFILSTKSGYRALVTETWNFDIETFVDFQNRGHVEWVQTFLTESKSLDQKWHTYWVHRLLVFRDDGLYPVDDFVPRWRMFTFQPNHSDTALLTKDVKDALLKEQIAKVPFYYLQEKLAPAATSAVPH
jgi:hypothetical protein